MDFRTKTIRTDLPLVTIGVLSYNYSNYIKEALNSLLLQVYPNIELIIIDDCSTERETVSFIEKWIAANDIHCTFIQNEINQGICKVSNTIISLSKGKYVSLFATDDIMLPEKIERQVEILEEAGESFGMCYANALTIDENGDRLGYYGRIGHQYKPEGDVLEKFVFHEFGFATPVALIRKSVYEKTGLYDERVLYEDYNFWLRLFAISKAKYCNYPCLMYRLKRKSAIFDEWNKNNKERYYRDRILSNLQGIHFTTNKRVRHYLSSKIRQYLKALSANRSFYLKDIIVYLLLHGFIQIPLKVLFSCVIKTKAQNTN